ncbi:MAG: hypothetical protein N2442_12870 [Spirochaetes bacterium]|nr:hypothetical protein [Spirochaetota bacterium]
MKRNQKTRSALFCSLILLGLLCHNRIWAEEGPKIKTYSEVITLTKDTQTMKVQAECVSDPEGFVYLPSRGKLSVKELMVKGSELKKPMGEDGKLKDLPYFRIQVDKPNTSVTVSLVFEGKDIVKEKESRLGETYPGRVTNYTRTFLNTTPVDIAKYSISLQLPEGKDIFRVTKPAKFEDLKLSVKGGCKQILPKAASVKAGSSYELVLDVCEQPASRNVAIWIVCGGVAVFFLVKRKDLLKKTSKNKQD